MIRKHYILQSTLIVILLFGIAGSSVGSDKPAPMEQTITAIRNCTAGSLAPWPNEWHNGTQRNCFYYAGSGC